jgi:hypothetical protein
MSKNIACFTLLAFAGAIALNLRAEPVWTTSSCAPSEWVALDGNILLGREGETVADGVPGYASGKVSVLTDGTISASAPDKEFIFGFRVNETVTWTFSSPMSIEEIRISTSYLTSTSYDGVHVSKVEARFLGESVWTEIGGEGEYKGENVAGKINSLILTNGDIPVAENIVALRLTFGSCESGFANYYTEIEAVGRSGSINPFLDSFGIEPAKTKAKLTGIITDCGTDATACNVYLALDGGVPVRIAKRVTDSFEYQIEGLTPATTYAYTLSISNNAPIVKGISRSGTFTTMPADAQTASWTQGEYSTDAWTPLENNILGGLTATEKSGVSFAASQEMSKLTDGVVPNPAKGAETVGFTPDGTVVWSFEKPEAIEKIRISSLWESTLYNGISVNAIYVKYGDSTAWESLDVPAVEWTGGTALGQMLTLTDLETGFIAKNITALKITFGKQKAAIANYYAEIEAARYVRPKKFGFTLLVR